MLAVLERERRSRVADRQGNDRAVRELDAEREAEIEERAQDDRMARTLIQLSDHDQRAIAEIDEALARLDDGTYGICETCGVDIPIERLRAVPTSRRCVDCQRAEEGRRAGYALRTPPSIGAGIPVFGDDRGDEH